MRKMHSQTTVLYMEIHFAFHRKHYVLPSQRQISDYCTTRIIIVKCETYMQYLCKYTVWAKFRFAIIKPSSTHSLSMKYLWAAIVTTERKGNGRKKLSFLCLPLNYVGLFITLLVCAFVTCRIRLWDYTAKQTLLLTHFLLPL